MTIVSPALNPEGVGRVPLDQAYPTAAQWMCCAAAAGSDLMAFQQSLYKAAHDHAVRSVAATALWRDRSNFN